MRVLVTGGCGFLGSHVCEFYVERGNDVVSYDNMTKHELKRTGFIEFSIYNIKGELIHVLDAELKNPGNYRIQWNGRNSSGIPISTGTYFYQLRYNQNQMKSGKLLFIK